ncbi:histidinol dehydrogenase [Ostreococcus tauri]|uniref:Histidinol dehydrogenase, chloroplastic n=2 Tax=Ostreococcus tauri TaxID=70448 RepID=A0A1Y5HYQ7_OSTTA|nr:histidinol dehydrogenase [Ostreococcus tauri]OUS45059.1 histidinol dehydrogenase [Ostreococcus tauri]
MSARRASTARGASATGARARTRARAARATTATQAVARPGFAMKTYVERELDARGRIEVMKRPRVDFTSILDVVRPIVEAVETRGDDAVREYTRKFDECALAATTERVEDLPDPTLDADVQAAFDVAYDNIAAFHAAQARSGDVDVTTMPGVRCRRVSRPIEAVGLYVPGGTAVLPSTALMLAVPAKIAGCKRVVLATPPRKDGSICPEVLYVAKKAGVTHILKAGGAQAVAAMGFGTETCPKVDKIFGPGNQFVTAAKMALQNSDAMVSIDMPAGPSEVLVIADKDAPAAHVAADLLSQAEHGPDSQVVLVTFPDVDLKAITDAVADQASKLPRAEITSKALGHSYAVVVDDMDAACDFSNRYAPEHLIVNVENAESWLPKLDNAGSIFLGRWTPESVGDYASGTNHVLPTYGYSRMYSGVSLDSFVKYMTVQELTKAGLDALGPHVARMATVEGLDAHRSAVTLRLGID